MANQVQKYGAGGVKSPFKYILYPFLFFVIVMVLRWEFIPEVIIPFIVMFIVMSISFFSTISPRSKEIVLYEDHFLIQNAVLFWKPKLFFKLNQIVGIDLHANTYKDLKEYFKITFKLKDGRRYSYKIYDDNWRGVWKYFHKKGFPINLFY